MSEEQEEAAVSALTRFTERLQWFDTVGAPTDALPADTVQVMLEEWKLVEPHLETLKAMMGAPFVAPLMEIGEGMRARLRIAFLFAVKSLLEVLALHRDNEMLMRLPSLAKRLSAVSDRSPEAAEMLKRLEEGMRELPEPEVVFRESMEAADRCEEETRKLHQQLLKEWPEYWTEELQRRLENLNREDHEQWLGEVTQELAELGERYYPEAEG